MDIAQEEIREKEKDFSMKGTNATMVFSVVIAVILLLGNILNVLTIPLSVLYLLALVFIIAYALFIVCKRNIFSPAIPYAIIIVNTLVLTTVLGIISPEFRTPFFLIYLYVVLHPALLLGRTHGISAIAFVDVAYLVKF